MSKDLIKWNWILIAQFASINQEESFLFYFSISSISIPPSGISSICILNLFFEEGGEAKWEKGSERAHQTFLKFSIFPPGSWPCYICYISLNNLRNMSKEAFDKKKKKTERREQPATEECFT